jgi:hypothetical protein
MHKCKHCNTLLKADENKFNLCPAEPQCKKNYLCETCSQQPQPMQGALKAKVCCSNPLPKCVFCKNNVASYEMEDGLCQRCKQLMRVSREDFSGENDIIAVLSPNLSSAKQYIQTLTSKQLSGPYVKDKKEYPTITDPTNDKQYTLINVNAFQTGSADYKNSMLKSKIIIVVINCTEKFDRGTIHLLSSTVRSLNFTQKKLILVYDGHVNDTEHKKTCHFTISPGVLTLEDFPPHKLVKVDSKASAINANNDLLNLLRSS